jgi:hypothetical protein
VSYDYYNSKFSFMTEEEARMIIFKILREVQRDTSNILRTPNPASVSRQGGKDLH